MASRGKTVAGTDGTDHTFREKVAWQYQESARLKKYLCGAYFLLITPSLLLTFHVLRVNDVIKFTNQILPQPELWESFYISSLIFNFMGYTSLSRNNIKRLTIYCYGAGVTALGSIVWGASVHAYELRNFVTKGRTKAFLFGQPLVVLIFLFLGFAAQMNICAINYAWSLLKAWKAKGSRSK